MSWGAVTIHSLVSKVKEIAAVDRWSCLLTSVPYLVERTTFLVQSSFLAFLKCEFFSTVSISTLTTDCRLYIQLLLNWQFRPQSRSNKRLPLLIQFLLHGMSPLKNVPLGRVEAAILAESALIDRETGRVFWEGGTSNTLYESLAPKLDQLGAEHLQATILTAILSFALISVLAGWIQRAISSFPVSSSLLDPRQTQLLKILIIFAEWTILMLPKIENPWLVLSCILLYLIESYNCSTRRFLSNPITSSVELDEYLDRLRQEPPVVTWKLKTFHYEYRKLLLLPQLFRSIARGLIGSVSSSQLRDFSREDPISTSLEHALSRNTRHTSPKSIFARKVITNEASAVYQFASCKDDTMVGMWTRAQAADTVAPLTKIALTKLLILADSRSREDFFQQQSDFVTKNGQGDEFVDFSTNIQVAGYRPRVLVVRPFHRFSRFFTIHFFWVFTVLGLTVPFRIWFKRHCDFVRVTIVKETSFVSVTNKAWGSNRGWSVQPNVGETIYG